MSRRLKDWPIYGVGWERRVNMLIAEAKEYTGDTTPMAERISDGAKAFNVTIRRATPVSGKVLRIKDIFTTFYGSWEISSSDGSLPQWARDTYLRPFGAPDYFDDAGADHHLFGGVFDEAGLLAAGHAYQQSTDWHLKHPSL